jgi:predicted nucleic acid-binding protein
MQNNIYVDTNIVVDMCDNKRALHENSFEMITNYLEQDKCELFINSDTLANLFYILSNRSTLNAEEVLEKMQFVNEIFTLVSIESEDVAMALDLCADVSSPHKDYEDAMQYVCALRVEANVIVTNDKGFISLDIEVFKTQVE